jgi:hypothetical protein
VVDAKSQAKKVNFDPFVNAKLQCIGNRLLTGKEHNKLRFKKNNPEGEFRAVFIRSKSGFIVV